jgi:hypothetical protein
MPSLNFSISTSVKDIPVPGTIKYTNSPRILDKTIISIVAIAGIALLSVAAGGVLGSVHGAAAIGAMAGGSALTLIGLRSLHKAFNAKILYAQAKPTGGVDQTLTQVKQIRSALTRARILSYLV